MKRVVFCWELGGNYGHITGFVDLARELKLRGCEVLFVLRDLQYASVLQRDFHCVQAPLPNLLPVHRTAYNYSGILAAIGYLQPQVLAGYTGEWRQLFLDLQADLVIADHAPTAVLAARSAKLPVALIGTGFVIPPVVDGQFPSFQSQYKEPDAQLDNKLLATINRVLSDLGGDELKALGDMFVNTSSFLCTLPELDHYGVRPETDYWGPLFSAGQGIPPSWPAVEGERTFAYLTPKLTNLPQVVSALAHLPGSKLLHIPGVSELQRQAWSTSSLSIESEPVNMRQVLAAVDLVVSQGGMGMSAQCVLAGARHVILPTQMEQNLLARRLSEMGLAYAIDSTASEESCLSLFKQALSCPTLAANSRKLAQRYQGFSQAEQVVAMADEMMELLLPRGK